METRRARRGVGGLGGLGLPLQLYVVLAFKRVARTRIDRRLETIRPGMKKTVDRERTHEPTEALLAGREGRHPEAASVGEGTDLEAM